MWCPQIMSPDYAKKQSDKQTPSKYTNNKGNGNRIRNTNGKATAMKACNPATITTMRRLSLAAVLFLCVQMPLFATPPKKQPPKDFKKVTDKLTLDMLKKYQSVKTYHSIWQAELKQGNMEMRLEYETAYERKSGKTLFAMRSFRKNGDQWVPLGGQLQIYDGANQKVALTQAPGQPMREKVKPISDPNNFTYRDFRRGLAHIYPFDLPLLFPDNALTEYPLTEILQATLKEIKVTKPDPKKPAEMIMLELMTDGTCVRLHLDPKTLLIKDFAYFRKGTGGILGQLYKQVSCKIDKPLKPGLFDFKLQVKTFEPGKPKKKPAQRPNCRARDREKENKEYRISNELHRTFVLRAESGKDSDRKKLKQAIGLMGDRAEWCFLKGL